MSLEASISSLSAVRSSTSTAFGQGQRVDEPFEKTPKVAPKVANERSQSGAERIPELPEAVNRLSDVVQMVRRAIQFRIDTDSGRTVITVIDRETHEIIRQIPPEEVLAIANHLNQEDGLILRGQA